MGYNSKASFFCKRNYIVRGAVQEGTCKISSPLGTCRFCKEQGLAPAAGKRLLICFPLCRNGGGRKPFHENDTRKRRLKKYSKKKTPSFIQGGRFSIPGGRKNPYGVGRRGGTGDFRVDFPAGTVPGFDGIIFSPVVGFG